MSSKSKTRARKKRWWRKLKGDKARHAAWNAACAKRMQRRSQLSKRKPPAHLHWQTDSIINTSQLRRPFLKYIDERGRVHLEEELSAEELIRRFTRSHQGEG